MYMKFIPFLFNQISYLSANNPDYPHVKYPLSLFFKDSVPCFHFITSLSWVSKKRKIKGLVALPVSESILNLLREASSVKEWMV